MQKAHLCFFSEQFEQAGTNGEGYGQHFMWSLRC